MIFVTSNHEKFKEAKEILGVELVRREYKYPELQAAELEKVVTYGVSSLRRELQEKFFIEDAGLFIKPLNDFPGVYSKHAFYTLGLQGILKLLGGVKNRDAIFKSVIGLWDGAEVKIFKGVCEGRIALKAIGKQGFGFDPIFIPCGKRKTFAQMGVDEKNQYSHRGKALAQLSLYLKTRNW